MRQRGFTIVELVVTITVLALMLFVAMPSIGTWLANTRIRNTAESLQSGLQTARSEAIRRNQRISFYLVSLSNPGLMDNTCALSNTSSSWVVSASSPVSHCGTAPSTTEAPMIVTSRAAGAEGANSAIRAAHNATTGTTVTFNGFGQVFNPTEAITQIDVLGPDGDAASTLYRTLRVTVSSTGGVRMCDPSTNLPATDPRRC